MKKTSKFQSNIMSFQEEIARLKGILSASRGDDLSVGELKSEHDFLSYVELLKKFAKRYTIMIAASDTPCGMAYTQEVSRELMGGGLKSICPGSSGLAMRRCLMRENFFLSRLRRQRWIQSNIKGS